MSVPTASCPPLEVAIINAYTSIHSVAAAAFLSVVVSACAWGVTCCQTFYYFRSERAKKDNLVLKTAVAILMTLCTLQEALIVHAMYYYLIDNSTDPCIFLKKVVWSFPAEAFLNGPIHVGVEGFLIYRTWQLGRNIYVAGGCIAMIITTTSLYTVYMVKLWLSPSLVTSVLNLRQIGLSTASAIGVADGLITISMLWYLRRNRTSFSRTNGIVTKLMIITISTGALSTLITLAEVVSYAVDTRYFSVVYFNFLVGKMYLNSMLTSLNLRSSVREAVDQGSMGGVNSVHLDDSRSTLVNGSGDTVFRPKYAGCLTALFC